MDGGTSTAQGWRSVAGRRTGSLPEADTLANALFWRRPRAGLLELGASPEAVAVARHYVRGCLGEWACPIAQRDDMELICSELVSNAVQATLSLPAGSAQTGSLRTVALPGLRPVGLRLLGSWQRIVLEVWDCHPGEPLPGPMADVEAEGGRGLAIVHELASRWGSRRLGAHVKAVWAELLLPASHHGEQ